MNDILCSIYIENKRFRYRYFIASILTTLSLQSVCNAQIIPDQSLGNQNSVVLRSGPNLQLITGGALRGENLLHSFSQFSIGEGSATYFQDPGVKNIISRVTGNNTSRILGLLGVRGNANLYILNPSGFIFGNNSKIDIGGALTISTAQSIEFEKDYIYDVLSKNNVPTIDLGNPASLNFANSPQGEIQVLGNGHKLFQPGNIFAPVTGFGQSADGLITRGGRQISFFGRKIRFDAGLVTSPSGNITVSAIKQGKVKINQVFNGIIYDYSSVSDFGNISLLNQSLLDVSGLGLGNISLVGKNITVSDASLLINSNFSLLNNQPGGQISIDATGTLDIIGLSNNVRNVEPLANGVIPRGIVSQTFNGRGAEIKINAKDLLLKESSGLISSTFGAGTGGQISINTDTTQILGGSPFGAKSIGSLLLTTSAGNGRAGNLFLNTNKLSIRDGGYLISAAFRDGQGGDVFINSKVIDLTGGIDIPEALTFNPSSIASTTISSGNAGNLSIVTDSLFIDKGARVTASTLSSGKAGKINISANNIDLSGEGINFGLLKNPSSIDSSAVQVGPFLQFIFNLSENLTGDSGEIKINSQNIKLREGALIAVQNDGTGNAGEIQVNSNSLDLDNSAISSKTNGGNGGNTVINSSIITLRSSQINSTATLSGNGGNTTIVAKAIAGDYQSAITANADQGFGGNINIDTLALVFPLSNITATSQRGVDFDGSINIKSVEFTRIDQATKQPIILDRSLPEICNSSINERNFLISAADIPEDMDNLRESDSPLSKVPYSIDNKTGKKILDIGVQGWIERPDGKAETIAFNNLAFGGSYLVNACRELSNNAAKK